MASNNLAVKDTASAISSYDKVNDERQSTPIEGSNTPDKLNLGDKLNDVNVT